MRSVPLLLGLVDSAARTPPAPPHRRVRSASGLDALVLDTRPQAEGDPEGEALGWAVAQAAILSAYAAQDDVLPVALGAAFTGDGALVAHLEALAPWIAARRAALAGVTEYVVAIDASEVPAPAPDAGTGNDYLRRRKAQRDVRRSLEADRHAFATCVIAALRAAGARLADPRAAVRNSLVTVSALLPRKDVSAAIEALKALAPEGQRLGLAVRMVGPCAPFSFVSPEAPHA
jgi:hypothetical protein